jgi:hypothetical protein
MTRLVTWHGIDLIICLSLILVPGRSGRAVPVEEEPSVAPATARYVLSDIGFEIEAPDGFKLKQGLWYHDGLRASLDFAYAKGKDFKSVAAEFTAEGLQAAGHKLINKQDVEVSGTRGLLVHISHTSCGGRKIGWFVVFPDGEGVCQVGAIFPADKSPAIHDAMRKAVLSVKRTKPR